MIASCSRPVFGDAQIDGQRVGLSLGQHGNCGPIPHRKSHRRRSKRRAPCHRRHWITSRSIPRAANSASSLGQLRAGAGLGDVDMGRQAAVEKSAPKIAVACADYRSRRRSAPRQRSGHGGGPRARTHAVSDPGDLGKLHRSGVKPCRVIVARTSTFHCHVSLICKTFGLCVARFTDRMVAAGDELSGRN